MFKQVHLLRSLGVGDMVVVAPAEGSQIGGWSPVRDGTFGWLAAPALDNRGLNLLAVWVLSRNYIVKFGRKISLTFLQKQQLQFLEISR